MSREALVLLVCCCDFRDGAERLIPSKSLRNAVIRAFPGLLCILRMCAPRRAAAVVRPRGREKSADRRRRILISRLLIIRTSVPRRKSPFPAYFKGFPAVSPLIPPYPAFLKYPVSPHLRPEYTGALFVFTKCDAEDYQAFVLNSEEDIDQFLDAFGISPTETNQLIDAGRVQEETQERIAIQEFIAGLTVDFPLSEEMSAAARDIQNRVYDHLEFIRTNPDRKIIDWTNTEYALFRAIEHARYGDAIARGFTSVDEFITMANMVLNRRKSRAGKSLEHHLSAIFDGNEIIYTAQAVTEGNKKPDFIFPSQASYHDMTFPTERLISLAAKTTCKDRWRQVINEADRLRDRPKYLCTLQQGISPAQMDEMQSENVILVVPRQYITSYPADRQDRIWTLSKFVSYVREVEGL